jgi:uncharacterized protein
MRENPGDGVELTGNETVSLPSIDRGMRIEDVNVLHGGLGGLVEWSGDGADAPLLVPELRVGGAVVPLEGLQWRRLDRWIPVFTGRLQHDLAVSGTVCAPVGYPAARGFMVRLEIENGGRAPLDVEVALRVNWRWSQLRIVTARPLPGPNRIARAGSSAILETHGGTGPALAVDAGPDADLRAGAGPGDLAALEEAGLEATNGADLRMRISRRLTAVPRKRVAVTFWIGAGRERDGAVAAAAALRRGGADHWLRQARLELSHTLRAGHDHRWSDLLNRNLLFNRYFATARGIDDDRLYLLRSRVPGCPSPAVFNEREALFWTLPALVLVDPGVAREALFRVLDTFSERSGELLRYVDGGALDAGFSLEQALLYAWAIDHYATAAGDPGVLDEPLARQVLQETDAALFMRLHAEQMLAGTELLPAGDPADHPYTTTGNVLLWWFCEALPRLLPRNGEEPPPRFDGAGAEVMAAIWQHCVADLDGTPVLASSADLQGGTAVYDDPDFSLALLPFLGFCAADDPVWTASMEFLRSASYPLWRDGAVGGVAGRADPAHPRLAGLCAELLTPDPREALQRLLQLRLPGSLAAAAWDPSDGSVREPGHASLAGFLAWTLARAAEAQSGGREARRNRR